MGRVAQDHGGERGTQPHRHHEERVAGLQPALGARVRLDDVPVTGHCFGADSFIGYAAARAEGRLRAGDPFLMVAVGLGATFSAMVLRYAPHETEEPA